MSEGRADRDLIPADPAAVGPASRLARRTLAARGAIAIQANAAARTLHVGPGGYASIADALAEASPKDNVVVAPGEYRETGFLLQGNQALVGAGDERDDVSILITSGTVHIAGEARLERVTIARSEDRDADTIREQPLVRVDSGSPDMTNVSLEGVAGEDGLELEIAGGNLYAGDSSLGRVTISGTGIPLIGDCQLTNLWVAGSFPKLRLCTISNETLISDAGGGTFVGCTLGRDTRPLFMPSVVVGLEVRDPGSHPVLRECNVAGGYRGAAFWRGAGGVLEDCELRTLWTPGRLALFTARTRCSDIDGLPDGWTWFDELPPDAPSIVDLAWQAIRIDGRVLMKGLPLEATPARFFEPERLAVVAIQDRHTSPGLSGCRLYGPSAIALDPASSPTLLDYQWIEADLHTGWRALVPPEGPRPDADGPFAAMNRADHERELKEYPRRAKQWAVLRDNVEAGQYD